MDETGDTRPRLRALEALPTQIDGQEVVILRDTQGYSDERLVLSPGAAFLAGLMDGERTRLDIQADWVRATGEVLPSESLAELLDALDQARFLDNKNFARHRGEVERAFRAATTRDARHAGGAYAADPEELEAQFRAWNKAASLGEIAPAAPTGRLKALLAPHIDFHRGGPTYARAYAELVRHSDADRYVIFGISHAPMDTPFALTRKDFATPHGLARTDRDFVDALARRTTSDFFADEWNHAGEHSAEFQAVALTHALGKSRAFSIVPILASPPAECLEPGGPSPWDVPRVREFFDAMLATLAAAPGRTVLIGGVDLAHKGMQFGEARVTPEQLEAIARDDAALLAEVSAGDAEGFMARLRSDGNRNNICGVAAIYTVTKLVAAMGAASAEQLDYQQWTDGVSTVSFAAMSFLADH